MSRNLSRKDSSLDPVAKGVGLASGAGRLAIGIGLFAAPAIALRGLGFGAPDPKTLAVARIAGGRDLVMGVETLVAVAAEDPERLRRATLYNAIADTGDALAFAAALASGDEEGRVAGRVGLPMAAIAAAGGFFAAAWSRRSS
jgi:uncharacterized protein DUF4267